MTSKVPKRIGLTLNFDNVNKEVLNWNFGVIDQNVDVFAKALSSFVILGSQLHQLMADDLTVYYHYGDIITPEEKALYDEVDQQYVSNTVKGLLDDGAKYLDAIFYLGLSPKDRPKPHLHAAIEEGKKSTTILKYNDMNRIAQFVFVFWFYMLVRAHPPTAAASYIDQKLPNFLSAIMGITCKPDDIATYLASFDLEKVNPYWIKKIKCKDLGSEVLNRLGLGVAGYRQVSIFNTIIGDKYTGTIDENSKDEPMGKPPYYDTALAVFQSFKVKGACWAFHPATRDPRIIAKYGNINKNASNFMLEVYKRSTLERLVKLKKINNIPIFDESHTNYRTWTLEMIYTVTEPIFDNK